MYVRPVAVKCRLNILKQRENDLQVISIVSITEIAAILCSLQNEQKILTLTPNPAKKCELPVIHLVFLFLLKVSHSLASSVNYWHVLTRRQSYSPDRTLFFK